MARRPSPRAVPPVLTAAGGFQPARSISACGARGMAARRRRPTRRRASAGAPRRAPASPRAPDRAWVPMRPCWPAPRRADRNSLRARPPARWRSSRRRWRGRGMRRLAGGRRLALAGQQIADAADDHLRLERLDEHAVAPDGARPGLVDGLEGAGQQQHGNVRQLGIALDERRHLVAVAFRHADVGQHDVRTIRLDALDRLLPVADGHDLDVLVGERQLDHSLNGDAVVGQQQLGMHYSSTRARSCAASTRARTCAWMKSMICCIGVPGRKMPLTPAPAASECRRPG